VSPVRALVLEAPRQLALREFADPDVDADDAVLRVEACGLCGTDHEEYTGLLHPGYAFVPGHETIGVIESIGPAAAERWGVASGDRVAVEVFRSCGECPPCLEGRYRFCDRNGLRTMYGFVAADQAPGLWGGYGERQYLAPDSQVLRVPDGLDAVTATIFNPLGAGIRWGVTLPGTGPGDVVAVLGPGIRGLCAAAAAKDAGAAFVMVTGYGERDAERLATARDFGADLTVDVAVDDPVAALRVATGGRADVVVDVTAKAPAAFGQALALARPGGTVVVAGVRGGPIDGFQPDVVVSKELRILGAFGVDVVAYRAALDLLASARWPFAELPHAVAGFDDLDDLLQVLAGERTGAPPVHAVFVPGATEREAPSWT
jgi:alcohol dehydrogenase